jgi:hypothetical protein
LKLLGRGISARGAKPTRHFLQSSQIWETSKSVFGYDLATCHFSFQRPLLAFKQPSKTVAQSLQAAAVAFKTNSSRSAIGQFRFPLSGIE